ncbi:tRNA (guanosine(37)-N1)-methyltransferase TrmD [soil metagenome]
MQSTGALTKSRDHVEVEAKLRFDIFSLFPDMFVGPFAESIIRKAIEAGHVRIQIHDLRDWAHDRHRTVDDRPYGGGAGMVMMAPPIVEAVESVLGADMDVTRILVMSPGGVRFHQHIALEMAQHRRIAIVCGHYEGIDQRAINILEAEEVSIGNYVLTGGELPAMVILDSITRLIPGVINPNSIAEESNVHAAVEHAQYTRPVSFRGLDVPEVLISGHHGQIAEWRKSSSHDREALRDQAEQKTNSLRPDESTSL